MRHNRDSRLARTVSKTTKHSSNQVTLELERTFQNSVPRTRLTPFPLEGEGGSRWWESWRPCPSSLLSGATPGSCVRGGGQLRLRRARGEEGLGKPQLLSRTSLDT